MSWALLILEADFGALFQLDGSMIIIAENVMAAMGTDESGEPVLEYGHRLFSNSFYCRLYYIRVQLQLKYFMFLQMSKV